MSNINYQDILNRGIVCNNIENMDNVISESCDFYKTQLLESDSQKSADKFIDECAKSIYACNKYYPQIIYAINRFPNDAHIVSVFESTILKNLKHPEAVSIATLKVSNEDKTKISEAVKMLKNCDRIIANHKVINEKCQLYSFTSRYKDDPMSGVYKCCATVDKFKLPIYGKINIAIEEMFYILDREDIKYDKSSIIDTVQEYFMMTNDTTGNLKAISDALHNSRYIHEEVEVSNIEKVPSLDDNYDQPIQIFLISPIKSYDMITSVCDQIISISDFSFLKGFAKFLDMLFIFMMASLHEDIKNEIYTSLSEYIYQKMYEIKGIDENFRDLVESAIKSLYIEARKVDTYSKKYESDIDLCEVLSRYKTDFLLNLASKLEDLYKSLYPAENIENMTEGFIDTVADGLGKAASTIGKEFSNIKSGIVKASDAYKVRAKSYQPSNLISAVYGIDKYLSNKLQSDKTVALLHLKALKHKIYNESNLYDMITPDGQIDYTISSFFAEEGINGNIHDKFNDYCHEINTTILKGTDFKCYYETTTSVVSLHIRDTKTTVSLDEEDQAILARYFRVEDAENINTILNVANHGALGFGTTEAAELFANCEYPEVFSTFVEVCKLAGVPKTVVSEIYNKADDNMPLEEAISFHNYNRMDVEKYNAFSDSEVTPEIRLEAFKMLHDIVYESYDEDDDDEEDPDDEFGDKDEDVKDSNKSTEESKKRHNDYVVGKKPEEGNSTPKKAAKAVANKVADKASEYHPIQGAKDKVSFVAGNAANMAKGVSDNVKKSIDKIGSNVSKVSNAAKAVKAKAMHEDAIKPVNTKLPNQQNKQQPKQQNNSKPQNNKKPDNNTEEKPKFNPAKFINDVQLSLQGLKKNMTDLGAKEQNACRNIDAAVNSFTSSIKTSMTQDRREAILKGQLFPSFSKALKAFIPVAGLTAAGLPIAAMITAFGGLALTKSFDKKERNLMLDDLDVEMRIMDKEIQNADANGQMKKLRALMRTQKQLQREYQNIKYNIQFGKNVLPNSHIGVDAAQED